MCFRLWFIRRSFPSEAHEQLKKRLYDLLQRNREFRALLLSGQMKQMPIGGLTFGCMTSSEIADVLPAFSSFFDIVSHFSSFSINVGLASWIDRKDRCNLTYLS